MFDVRFFCVLVFVGFALVFSNIITVFYVRDLCKNYKWIDGKYVNVKSISAVLVLSIIIIDIASILYTLPYIRTLVTTRLSDYGVTSLHYFLSIIGGAQW